MSNVPAVSISGKIPSQIDPREPFKVTAWLENRNAKLLDDLKVELRSDAIRKSATTSLGPVGSLNGTKTIEFSVQLDKDSAPIKDSLRIVVIAKEGDEVYELKSSPYDYEILSYGGLVDQHDATNFLIYKKDRITFFNDANTKFEGVAKVEAPIYKALFTKAVPKGTVLVEDGKRYVSWC